MSAVPTIEIGATNRAAPTIDGQISLFAVLPRIAACQVIQDKHTILF